MRYSITKPQKRLLDALRKLTAESGGVGPSFQELADAQGVSYASARVMAKNLHERGYVRWIPGRGRSLHIVETDSDTAKEAAA